jgi:putative ABC transport system permease protein
MESIWRDLRLGLRQLVEDKGFALAALLTLTLGIGATATIFTVVNAVLLKEIPYRDSGRLVMLQGSQKSDESGEVNPWPISQMDFADWRQRSTAFTDMSMWTKFAYNLEQGQQSQRLWGELVNSNYFSMLGFKPQLGRFFTPDEDARPLEQYVVVLGYNLWHTTFGADRNVLGRKLQLNGRTFQVIGVAPQGFRGLSDVADLWIPSMLPPMPIFLTTRSMRWVSGAARLKPGVTVEQAQQQLSGVTDALAKEFPENKGLGALVTPFDKYWLGETRSGLIVLTVGACLLLLIACINVGSLLVTRAVARQRAWSIRVALGASRRRMIRQLLTESLLLSMLGAVAGLLLSQWAIRSLVAFSGGQFPSFVQISMEPVVVAAIVGLAVLCGLAFGLVPILISFRSDLTQSLGREEKLQSRGKGWHRFQSAIVVAQVALALILSVNAILMAKSFKQLTSKDVGFKANGLLTFRIDIRDPKYFSDPVAAKLLREKYLPRIAAVPGVQEMAMADPTVPPDDVAGGYVTVEDHDSDIPGGMYTAIMHAVTPSYFDLLSIPILKGRGFDMQDVQTNVVVVSRNMAEQFWPGKDPIGKRLKIGPRGKAEAAWLTVVGVTAPVQHGGFQKEGGIDVPDMYLSLLQFVRRPLTANFLVRPKPGVPIEQLRKALHQEVMAIDPELPEYDMATLESRLAKQTSKARFVVILISAFAGLALVLAAIGIYGVTSYSITQRTREIAIRMSLGAARGSILRMVVGRGAVLAAVGLVLGLVTVFLLGRLLADVLYQTSITDPLILGGTSLGLFLVTLAANYFPARRASIVDPVIGLRLQ